MITQLYTILLNKKLNELDRQFNIDSNLPELLLVLAIVLELVKLFILHEHDSNGEVEKKEAADDNAADEVHVHEPA